MRTSSAEQFFAKVPLFAGLPKRYLRRLGSLVSVVDVEAGRVFIREGETGREFFVVMSGDAEIRKGDQVVAFRGPNEFFGEISLLLDRPRSATVVARTDMTLEVIERRDFRQLLTEHPELYEPLLTATAERLAALEQLPH